MKIQTIRYANPEQSTLIVNDTMSVPWPCHTWHNEMIQEWLDEGNPIAPYAKYNSLEQAKAGHIADINSECRRRILEVWPLEEQQSCSLGVYGPEYANDCRDWIAANIEASNVATAQVEAAKAVAEVAAVAPSWPTYTGIKQ
jgi:hypothetical protein